MISLQKNNEGVNESVKWQWEKKCRIMNRDEYERKRESRWIINTPLRPSHYIFTFSPLYFIEFIFTGTVHLISISVTLPDSLSWVVFHRIVPQHNVNAVEISLTHQVRLQ